MLKMFEIIIIIIFTIHQAHSIELCSKSQHLCDNGYQCISKEQVCDSHGDCDDYSDEFNCKWMGYTWCNFCYGQGLCGWDVHGASLSDKGCGLIINRVNEDKVLTRVTLKSSPTVALINKCKLEIKLSTTVKITVSIIDSDGTSELVYRNISSKLAVVPMKFTKPSTRVEISLDVPTSGKFYFLNI